MSSHAIQPDEEVLAYLGWSWWGSIVLVLIGGALPLLALGWVDMVPAVIA